ncbi:MAG: hypothetical protein JJU45_03500 [Acidimicrobiia bacterium]|nr:hypothetical protein [Acidimicrobiia bacterium]
MPSVEEQVRSYATWVHESWPAVATGEPESAARPLRQPSRARLVAIAVTVVTLAVVGSLVVASTGESEGERVEVAGPTTQPSSTSVPATGPPAAPLWSGPLCEHRDIDDVDDRFFPWVEMPSGFEWWTSRTMCDVLDAQVMSDEWRLGPRPIPEEWDRDPDTQEAAQHLPRVVLTRIELATTGVGDAERPGRAATVNGKPARFVHSADGPTPASSRYESYWVQDDNGEAIVVTEGLSERDTLAIAESFDQGVAEYGPRQTRRELTRDEALVRVHRMTSAVDVDPQSAEAKRMSWADVAEAAALPNPHDVDDATTVWVVAGGGNALPRDGVGEGVDHWGIVVIDAERNEVLAIATGGASDGTRWPPFFDSLPDHPAE